MRYEICFDGRHAANVHVKDPMELNDIVHDMRMVYDGPEHMYEEPEAISEVTAVRA